MDILLKPFIYIYHFVRDIYEAPRKLMGKEEPNHNYSTPINSKQANTVSNEDYKKNLVGIIKEKPKKASDRPIYPFRYTVININGKKETGIFEAETIDDAKNYLTSQDYKIIKLEPKKSYDIELFVGNKLSASQLAFSLSQLSTYIKAGIPLAESVRVLAKQSTKPLERSAYQRIVYDLIRGENLSDAMEKQGERFPRLLVNMIRTAEMTGDLPSILDDMADYYTTMDKNRRAMISAMTYPSIVLILAFVVVVFMLMYIVPSFVSMYESQEAELPFITLAVINASNFLKANYLWVLLCVVVFIVLLIYVYKNVSGFRKNVQIVLMHMPVVGNIIIYNEVSNFTKTFASLLNHGVLIPDCMEILSRITNNEVYKEIIAKTLYNLGKGDPISESFKGQWAFPIVAYEMIVTGENTGQLGLMMDRVADHFQDLHKNIIDRLKSLIEPFMIAALAGIVGLILVSIIVPMFDIYGKIQG